MGETTRIAWTNRTWNPWIGCTKVGPGCDHCYAEAQDARWTPGQMVAPHWGVGAPRKRTTPAYWAQLARWNRQAESSGEPLWVFCASLADVFDNEVDPQWRRDLWGEIRQAKHLRFQLVTKRIVNAYKMLPGDWSENFQHCGLVATTVTQEECDRDLPRLRDVQRRFGVRWIGLSIEPQIESVIPRDFVDWVITGGESVQRNGEPRLYNAAWARELIAWGASNFVRVFVKQMGSNCVDGYDASWTRLKSRDGSDPAEWPTDLRVRQFPRAYGVA